MSELLAAFYRQVGLVWPSGGREPVSPGGDADGSGTVNDSLSLVYSADRTAGEDQASLPTQEEA